VSPTSISPWNRFGQRAILPVAALLLHFTGAAAAGQHLADTGGTAHATDAPVARVVRTNTPIVIDGVLDEAVWMTAPPVTSFVQLVPDEGSPTSQRTEVRFLYDDHNLYVGAWLWDEIRVTTRLARRDAPQADSDAFFINLDSFHDHRTAYRLGVNPSGVKRDELVIGERTPGGALQSGGSADPSWDPVWDVATSITEEGWFAEMRIPFNQLRYSAEETQIWGLQLERNIRSSGRENSNWAYTPSWERQGVARFGHLVGIEGIGQGKRLELLPYVGGRKEYVATARNEGLPFDNPFRSGSNHVLDAGVDLKFRLTSNLTLDGTLNPDFGQVELDPAVINLTAFETRFAEKRPFFIEGAEIFRFGEPGGRPGPMDAQLLYSRRVGRAPQGAVPADAIYSEADPSTTILSAAKVTGKTPSGWSVGLMNAVTARETAAYIDRSGVRGSSQVEPLTNYLVGRIRRDLREGAVSYGLISTAVHRDLEDPMLRGRLRAAAYALGLDARLESSNREWALAAELSPSHTTGDPGPLQITQRSSVRYYQRPDADHLDYDPTATSLSGVFARADLSKRAGLWRGRFVATAISPGYEVNDLGFQLSADRLDLDSNFGYEQTRPGPILRMWSARFGPSATWNFAGEAQAIDLSLIGTGQLRRFQDFSWTVTRHLEVWNDRLTRGGPLTREPARVSGRFAFGTDRRHPVQLLLEYGFQRSEAGDNQHTSTVQLTARRGDYEIVIGPDLRRTHSVAQYVATVADTTATHTHRHRYLFGELDEATLGLVTRLNATFTPTLSLEVFAQPFLSSGRYDGFKELAAGRTFTFREFGSGPGSVVPADGRITIDPDGEGPARPFTIADPNFNVRSLLGNAVLRWEWRAGSTFFLVWQQTRYERLAGGTAPIDVGSSDLGRDAGDLFRLKPDNIFLIKVNFWMNP